MKLETRHWIRLLWVLWVAPTMAFPQDGTIYFVGEDEESVFAIDVESGDVRFIAEGDIHGRLGDGIVVRRTDGAMLATSSAGLTIGGDFDATNRDPDWSDDGTQVVYRRDRSLYTANWDGSGEVLLVEGANRGVWSPTEPGVVYFSRRKQNHAFTYDTFRIATKNPEEEVVADGRNITGTSPFSPDGSKLLITGCGDGGYCISYVEIATGAIKDFGTPLVQEADWPMWSPDSRQLLFSRSQGMLGLHVLDVVKGESRWLHHGCGGAAVAGAVWSPDGEHVALHCEDFSGGAAPRLLTTRADGDGAPRELAVGRWAVWTDQQRPPVGLVEASWGEAREVSAPGHSE